MLTTADKSSLDMYNPRPNYFRRNDPPPQRYLQLSDWKSGTNCSSSGTCAGKEIFISDLSVVLKSKVKCFIWKIGQSKNLPSANQASWSWLRSWNNSGIENRRHQNENCSAGERSLRTAFTGSHLRKPQPEGKASLPSESWARSVSKNFLFLSITGRPLHSSDLDFWKRQTYSEDSSVIKGSWKGVVALHQ